MFAMNSRIGQLLHADHQNTLSMLEALDGLLDRHGAKAPDPASPAVGGVLTKVVKGIDSEVARHFGFEENELFPVLAGAGQTGMTMMLIQEHRMILPVAEAVGELAAAALEAGAFTPEAWTEFREVATELCEREMFHIQKEEMGLLAAIASLVNPSEDQRLAAAFEAMG